MYTLHDIFEGDYPITQYYGARPAYYSQFGLAGHEGVDWWTPTGVWITNPFDTGIVLRTGWDGAYGYFTVIWDPVQKCAVWHCHLSQINVSAGQRLSLKQRAGRTGATGNVTGPHLHWNFVVTDAYGNRLNRNNGYQGFLNGLNKQLVRWVL